MDKTGRYVVNFTCDIDLINWIEAYAKTNRINKSEALRYLIRMGRVYLQVLEGQLDDTKAQTTIDK